MICKAFGVNGVSFDPSPGIEFRMIQANAYTRSNRFTHMKYPKLGLAICRTSLKHHCSHGRVLRRSKIVEEPVRSLWTANDLVVRIMIPVLLNQGFCRSKVTVAIQVRHPGPYISFHVLNDPPSGAPHVRFVLRGGWMRGHVSS